jgi:putative flippase GtrA
MSGRKLKLAKRFAEFSASSLLGTAVDTAILWVFSKWVFHTYAGQFLISPAISFECAVLTNFIVAYFLIWKDRISARTRRSFLRHFAGYNISCLGAFIVKMIFLLLIQRLFKLNVIWCNLLALCVSGGLNFILNEKVVFRRKNIIE